MPTEGTPRQNFRYPLDKWRRFVAVAAAAGTNASAILQEFVDWYIREPKSKAPKRPDPTEEN